MARPASTQVRAARVGRLKKLRENERASGGQGRGKSFARGSDRLGGDLDNQWIETAARLANEQLGRENRPRWHTLASYQRQHHLGSLAGLFIKV